MIEKSMVTSAKIFQVLKLIIELILINVTDVDRTPTSTEVSPFARSFAFYFSGSFMASS